MDARSAHPSRARCAAFVAAVLVAAFCAAASAQNIEVRVSPGPYYARDPVDVEVHTEGFERRPEPTCLAPAPASGTLHLRGISPNVQSSIQIVNGRMTRTERVRFVCHFQFIAERPGDYALGPFTAEQRGVVRRAGPLSLTVSEIPLDRRFSLEIGIPEEPVFVGQHVPVTLEWWLGSELRDQIQRFVVRSELFRRVGDFRFVDDQRAERGEQGLVIDTPDGEVELSAQVTQEERDGASYLVVRALRTLVPMRPGVYELEPGVVQVEEVVRWRRDLFGRRTPAQTRRRLALDAARTLTVLEPPREDRPASYAGAVGRGFSLDVAADRSVVQVGDPIALTLSVRGDGNLRVVGLPPLDADGGLSAEAFRLPEAEPSGRMDGESKVFDVSVRVLSADVTEIPALAYSWFDPEVGAYRTARSRPIALAVRPSEVVSAGDVVSGRSAEAPRPGRDAGSAGGAGGDPSREEETGSEAPSEAFALESADLSIERDPEVLLRRARRGGAFEWAVYAGSALALAAAGVVRRSANADPGIAEAKRVSSRERERIRATTGDSAAATGAVVASALREISSLNRSIAGEELEQMLRDCDEVAYAPEGAVAAGSAESLRDRALSLLDAAEGRGPR